MSRLALAACVALVALGSPARAQTTYFWTGGSGTWNNQAWWSTTLSSTTAANAVPDLTTNVVAPMTTATSTAITFTLTADGSARSLSFLPQFTSSGSFAAPSAQTFSLGAGGLWAGTGGFNTAANVGFRLADSQAWRFNSSATVNGGISRTTASSTNQTLLLSGSLTTTLAGVVSDGGSGGSLGLAFASSGTYNLNNANTYTGPTTLQANALLNLGFNQTIPSFSGTNLIASTGTLAFAGSGRLLLTGSANRTSSQSFAATDLQPGAWATVSLTPGSSGTADLNLGTLTSTGGILRLPTPSATSIVRVSGPDRVLPFGVIASSGSFAAVVGGTIQAATLTAAPFASGMTSSAGNYSVTASGTLAASGSANVILVPATSTTWPMMLGLGSVDLTVNAIRTDANVEGPTAQGIQINATTGRLLVGDTGELILGVRPGSYGGFTVSARIADSGTTPGRLVMDGAQFSNTYGGIALSGSNSFSGGAVLSGTNTRLFINHPNALGTGTFTIGGVDNRLQTSTNNTTIAGNAQIWNADFGLQGANSLSTGTGQVSLGSTATRTGMRQVSIDGTGVLTVPGTIVNGSDAVFPVTGLEKAGSGMLVLSGSNAYTGPTRVTAGALRFANRLAMYGGGTSAWTADNLTTASGGNLVVNVGGAGEFTDADIGQLAGLGTSTSGFLPGSFIGIDTTNVSSGTFQLTSQIANSNTIGIAKYGTGTLVLSGTNSFAGGVRATQNRVIVTVPAAMGSGTGVVDGGILDLGGGTFTNMFNVSSGTLTNGSFPLANLATSGSVTISTVAAIPANLTGAASFTKLGSGTLALLGTNTFSGSSRNAAGMLVFNSIGNVSGTAPNAFGLPTLATSTIGLGGATLVYNGSGHTTDRVFDMYAAGADTLEASGSGRLAITSDLRISGTGARTITLTGSGAGQISSIPNAANNTVVSLTKNGAGVWTITGSSGFTGTLTVSNGRLNLAHANVTSAATNVSLGSSGATPQLWAVGVSSTVGNVAGWGGSLLGADNGNLVVAGLTETGSNGAQNVRTSSSGTVTLQNMRLIGGSYPKNTWRGNANLVIGMLSGTALESGGGNSAAFTLNQTGVTRFTGDNTYVGPLFLGGGGTLVLDYTTNTGSKLADGYPLRLGGNMASSLLTEFAGADVVLRGTPAAAGGEEQITGLFGGYGSGQWGGAWNIGRDGGTGVLNTGSIAAPGSNDSTSWLNVRGGGIVKTVNANANGLLGLKTSVTGTNGVDFATVAGDGFVQPFTNYATYNLTAALPSGTSTGLLTGGGRVATAASGQALKIVNSGASDILDVNAGLGVGAGGSVLYAGGGDGKYTITGTGVILGNGRSGFYVAQDAELTLAAGGISATDNIASWAKSGPGTLVLALQRDWNSSGLGAGATLEGVTRWTNSNWFRLGWAVANSPAGSAVEFAPGAGLTGITSPSGVTATIGGGGINDQGAIRSRFGDNAILGNVFVQQPGARIHADAGTLRLSGTLDVPPNGHLSPTVTFGGAGTVLVDGPGNGITSSLIVNKDGPGTLIVTATSTYTGTTAVTGGELVWGRRVAFYNADTTKWNAFNFTTGSGAAMSFRVGDAAGAFTDADIATLATVGTNMGGFMAGSYIGLDTTGASSGSYAYAGNFADTAGGALGVAKSGSGTLTLTGTANTFTGGVLVRGGRLLLTGTNQIGSGVAVADGGLLDVNNQPITNAFSIRSGTIANATFEVSRLTANLNGPGLVSATLTGTGGLVKTGTGTLALSANNSFTGPTTLSQGLVSIGSDANLNGTSSALVFAGGGLQVTGTSLTALNPGRTTTFTPGSTVLFDVADPRNSFAVPQTLDQGAGGLTKSGSGTLRLAAASTYSGTTTISGGVLRLDDAGSLPGGIGATGGSSPLVLAGGVVGLAAGDFTRAIGSGTDQVWFGTGGGGFAAYGADRTVNLGGATAQITWNSATAGFRSQPLVLGAPTATNKVTLVNPLALGLDDRTVRVDDGSADVDGELSGVLSGSGGIVKTGAGRLVLSNANTYLGTTTVSGGVLRPGNALAIGGTANAITVNGGVLDLADYSLTRSAVVSLTSGTIASGTLAFTGTNAAFANGYVSSVVTGTMGFTVTSGNTLSFAGLNTYTGKVAAQSGVLEAAIVSGSGQASSLGSGTGANATIDLGNLATGGTFRYVGSTSATTNRIFNLSGTTGGGAIEANSVGALVISSTVTATGVGVKTLTLGGTSTAANTIGAISNGSGTTSVVKDGPGLWRINAVSSYTGSFTVRNGTLVAAADSTSTNGAFGAGSVTDVFVGDSSPTATGTAALLLAAGFNTTKVMNVQAGGGSQVVVLGGEGGAVDFQSSTYLGRGVTLVAGAGGTTSFSGFWYGSGGAGTSPTGNVSIGSAGNTGMVRVLRNLAPSGSVGVRFGTLSLGSTGTIAGSGPLAIDAGATLAGIGWVTGTLGGAGLVAPGNSPGILTAGAIDPLGGLDWAFELTGTAPDYTNSFNSVNDVLRLTGTGSSPFTTNLTGSNAIGVYFDVGSLTQGDTFRGGFFTDLGSDFRSSVIDATYAYWVTGSGVGQTTYESKTYVPLSSVYPSLGVAVTTVSDTASFSGGSPVTGQVMQFTVVVPEPGALALAALGLGLAGYALRRRRAA